MKGNISYSVLPGADEAQALLLPQSPISGFTLPAQLSKGLFPSVPTAPSAVQNHSLDASNTIRRMASNGNVGKKNSKDCLLGYKVPC